MNEKKDNLYKDKILTVPNILSFFRIGLIPVFVWLYLFEKAYATATVILLVSALTDVVDGIIARRFNMVSDFGKAFDPIADKLTQIIALLCLVSRFNLMLIPLIILVIKELFAGVVAIIVIKKTSLVSSAVWHGKVNTVLLYAMMLLHIVWYNIPPTVSNVSIAICTGMMLLSGILYGILNIKSILKSKKQI